MTRKWRMYTDGERRAKFKVEFLLTENEFARLKKHCKQAFGDDSDRYAVQELKHMLMDEFYTRLENSEREEDYDTNAERASEDKK